ncbi:MAG: TatD family hydrolase [Alphaproteobacteria bacterium]|nr:TatD family hydrolase [Alphaproteobacteria bacterium]
MTDQKSAGDSATYWVDFHCHLDLYPDPVATAVAANDKRVRTLAVTTTPRAWPHEREMFAHLEFIRLALGLHPELVAERASEIALWERYLDQTRYVGEVGLDGRRGARGSLPQQRAVFQRVLDVCAERGGKILTVHSAGIPADVVQTIVRHLPPDRGRVVLHWFVGSKSTTAQAVEHGCFFSLNAAMLQSETARKTLSYIPRDRILTETDGPFTKRDGRPAMPVDIPDTVGQLAAFFEMKSNELAIQVRTNLKLLLS